MATRLNHMLPAYDLFAGEHVFRLSDPEALRAVYESISAYNEFCKAPIYLNHNPDGPQFGEVLSYELQEDGIWAKWEIAEGVDPNTLPKFVSPRLVWGHMVDGVQQPGYRASDGTIYPIVVIELSVTGTPVFDIGQNPGITLSLSQTGTESGAPVYEFAKPLGENGMTPEQIKAEIAAALETMLAPLLARLDALEAAGAAAVTTTDAAATTDPAAAAMNQGATASTAATVDPMKEAEALMSRAKEVGAYVAELSQKHGANPNVMRNMDVVQEQFMRHGRADADKLVSRFVSTPTAGSVSDTSLSKPGGSFTDTTGMTPMQRAKAIQKQKGCSWENACREAGVPMGTVYANL